MKKPFIKNYIDPADYLIELLKYCRYSKGDKTLEQYAKEFGMPSQGYLSNILSGKRPLSNKYFEHMKDLLISDPSDKLMFEDLTMKSIFPKKYQDTFKSLKRTKSREEKKIEEISIRMIIPIFSSTTVKMQI